jgi:hypothetical protein
MSASTKPALRRGLTLELMFSDLTIDGTLGGLINSLAEKWIAHFPTGNVQVFAEGDTRLRGLARIERATAKHQQIVVFRKAHQHVVFAIARHRLGTGVEEGAGESGVVAPTESAPSEPPIAAHYLLRLFLPAKYRDNLIGDLLEEFHEDVVPVFGQRRAWFWFWKQTITSLFPVIRARVLKLLTAGWIIEWLRHTLR